MSSQSSSCTTVGKVGNDYGKVDEGVYTYAQVGMLLVEMERLGTKGPDGKVHAFFVVFMLLVILFVQVWSERMDVNARG
jgi:hypothetical protein